MGVRLVKANAYGNDFLLAPDDGSIADPPAFTRAVCARHLGVGADGLILFTMGERRATMRLWNADGSASELSGNGLRCLAAHVARAQDLRTGAVVTVDTDAGIKTLDLIARADARFTFRAAMGQPEDLRETGLVAAGESVRASVPRRTASTGWARRSPRTRRFPPAPTWSLRTWRRPTGCGF
jgi:diaminopimelate epimerase